MLTCERNTAAAGSAVRQSLCAAQVSSTFLLTFGSTDVFLTKQYNQALNPFRNNTYYNRNFAINYNIVVKSVEVGLMDLCMFNTCSYACSKTC